MTAMTEERWRTAAKALTAVLAVVAVIVAGPIWLNATTRIDAGQHVSNLPCGPGQYVTTCPGELVCASGPGGSFSEHRVGVRTEGSYCVTPVFEQRYCGILEPPQGFDDLTDSVLSCGPPASLLQLPAILLQTDLDLADLPDRILDTGGRGARWIHEQGLELLKDDPDSTEIPIAGYVSCDRAAVTIRNATYRQDRQELQMTVTNTGKTGLPNMTAELRYPGRDAVSRSLSGLAVGRTASYRVTANATPASVRIVLSFCGKRTIAGHSFDAGP